MVVEECLGPDVVESPRLAAVKSINNVMGYGKTRSHGEQQWNDGIRENIRAMRGYMNRWEMERPNKGQRLGAGLGAMPGARAGGYYGATLGRWLGTVVR